MTRAKCLCLVVAIAGCVSGGGGGGFIPFGFDGGPSDGPAVAAGDLATSSRCMNGVKDGPESDVDCGGDCRGCATGKACALGPDCESGVCVNRACAAPTCMD